MKRQAWAELCLFVLPTNRWQSEMPYKQGARAAFGNAETLSDKVGSRDAAHGAASCYSHPPFSAILVQAEAQHWKDFCRVICFFFKKAFLNICTTNSSALLPGSGVVEASSGQGLSTQQERCQVAGCRVLPTMQMCRGGCAPAGLKQE